MVTAETTVPTVPRIGSAIRGHFVNLGPGLGFYYGWCEDSQQGLFPTPYYFTSSSAGGIVAVTAAPWNLEHFKKVRHIFINLQGKQFYSVNRELEALGGLVFTIPFGVVAADLIKNNFIRRTVKGTLLGLSLAVDAISLKRLLGCGSIFVNHPLFSLLMENIDFDGAYKSPVKVEIIAADINGNPATNKQVRPVSVTNYKPEHVGQKRFLADMVRQGASIPGIFQATLDQNGHVISDSGIYDNVPLDPLIENHCDGIIVPDYNCESSGFVTKPFKSWLSVVHRSFDIVVDRVTELTISGYLRVNRDIQQLERLRESFKQAKNLSSNPDLTQDVRQKIENFTEDLERAVRNFSFANKKYINLLILKSRRKTPEFDFRHFNRDILTDSINIGYETWKNSKSEREEFLEKCVSR